MPIYEYACAVCGHRFEELQEMSDKPKEKCPKCGKKVTKLMSTAVPMSGGGKSEGQRCCGGEEQCGSMPKCHGGRCHM